MSPSGWCVVGARAGRVAFAPLRLATAPRSSARRCAQVGDALAADGYAARFRIEALVIEQLASPELERTIDRVVAAMLDDERTERVMERALASPGLERLIVRILDSHLVDALTERLLASPEFERVIGHVASSPD